MNPVCAFRRITLQIPEGNFWTGHGIAVLDKALIPFGMCSALPWIDGGAVRNLWFPTLDKGWEVDWISHRSRFVWETGPWGFEEI